MDELLPGLSLRKHSRETPTFYESLAELIADALVDNIVSVSSWKTRTNKFIYQHYLSDLLPLKVELDLGFSLKSTWKQLQSPSLDYKTRDIMFLMLHNKLPVRERLFRIQTVPDPYCTACLDYNGAVICDRVHYFCTCIQVNHVWEDIRGILLELLNVAQTATCDYNLLSLQVVKNSVHGNEAVWLLSNYIYQVWKLLHEHETPLLSREKMFGYLKYKFKCDQLGARPELRIQHFMELD